MFGVRLPSARVLALVPEVPAMRDDVSRDNLLRQAGIAEAVDYDGHNLFAEGVNL